MDKVAYWLWLTEIFGTGNERLWTAMKCFGEPDTAYWELCRNNHGLKLNQKELSNMYLEQNKELNVKEYYIDDGFSGTTFDRPAFYFNFIVQKLTMQASIKYPILN